MERREVNRPIGVAYIALDPPLDIFELGSPLNQSRLGFFDISFGPTTLPYRDADCSVDKGRSIKQPTGPLSFRVVASRIMTR